MPIKQKDHYMFTLKEIMAASENNAGLCINCGEEKDGCEPDAREYVCDCCGESKVYGAEELALMGFAIMSFSHHAN